MYASVKDEVGHPGRFEGLSAFDIWLVNRVEDGNFDEQTGSVDFGIWVARVGKRLVATDEHGFWYVQNYGTEDAAGNRFDLVDLDFCVWAGED